MNWERQAALELYRHMVPHFHNYGYLLLIYGSVVSGTGAARDLDIMAVPWRTSPVPPKTVFDIVCGTFRLSPDVGSPYLGLMRSWSKTARDREGRVIDFQFRRAEVTDEEALAFSLLRGSEEVR